ncbi:DUF6622 family protein [Pectobacterium atrosepticum]|uniref:DUF6622 family protein n=1 Tax=Pectobacterium atrosepticum TaxID=29471 RepID=UPI0003A1E8FB|nr:DUF6622 family protein [Pectobacterium atrosepticum]GKV84918.1 hypothetical protein PEC301296_12300 [Pectobacterium carotovorum subsp. carotovorum]AIA71611.1 hypothetical protein EV46_13670 [Pectobacterium atrosepticum]AIK13585.1 putative membrane protein [Pectobacterium atrosepticum]ATY90470.1 hypothetical protein CVS35_08975 [Pectobacterium atrosepticum]KFX16310.1 hypothetical protein JV34_05840 [Pectobacterium atrosepticum]
MENLLIILRHTPYWVWAVLGYLIYAGVKASQPRRQPLARMLIVPAVFMVWGISSIFHTLMLPLAAAGGFLLMLMIGLGIGWMWGAISGTYLPEPRCFQRTGSWWPLVLMLLTFCSRFYFSVQLAQFPSLAHDPVFCLLSGAASGITAGIFSGVSLRLLNQMRKIRPSLT